MLELDLAVARLAPSFVWTLYYVVHPKCIEVGSFNRCRIGALISERIGANFDKWLTMPRIVSSSPVFFSGGSTSRICCIPGCIGLDFNFSNVSKVSYLPWHRRCSSSGWALQHGMEVLVALFLVSIIYENIVDYFHNSLQTIIGLINSPLNSSWADFNPKGWQRNRYRPRTVLNAVDMNDSLIDLASRMLMLQVPANLDVIC